MKGDGISFNLEMRVGEDWVDGSKRERTPVFYPATGAKIAEVPVATDEDARAALEAAGRAHPEWARRSWPERATFLHRIAKLVRKNREHLASVVSLEEGKPLREAHAEIEGWTAGFFDYFASFGRACSGELLPSQHQDEDIAIRQIPFGVCVGITPWNFPSAMVARKVAPALMAGNAIVVKPSSLTPLSALALAQIFHEAGLPAGLVSVITGPGGRLGDALVRNPLTQLVTLTGSVGAGKKVYETGAAHIASVSLELGGKAPFIVMDDVEVDSAARYALTARFENNGQVCTAAERTYVQRRVYDQFLETYVRLARQLKLGDPFDDTTDLGPKVSKDELEKVEGMVNTAREQGAEVVLGGKRARVPGFEGGYWYEPTILTNVRNDMEIMQQEVFGPVSPIMAFDDFEEAIKLANDSQYGLSAYLFSNNAKIVHRGIRKIDFGELYINKIGPEQVNGFHTGYRLSGLGGDDGKHGLEKYLRRRTVYTSWRDNSATPLMPYADQR
jgi:lactaldehyde dehydrogenase / glycolaldehyde dehydrogenase